MKPRGGQFVRLLQRRRGDGIVHLPVMPNGHHGADHEQQSEGNEMCVQKYLAGFTYIQTHHMVVITIPLDGSMYVERFTTAMKANLSNLANGQACRRAACRLS